MTTAGPNSAGSGTSGGGAKVPWTTPENITASDDSRATAALSGANVNVSQTRSLIATGFAFAVPTGSTIDGIVVEVEKSASNTSGNPRDLSLVLTKDGSAQVAGSDDKSAAASLPTSDAYASFGGAADLWNATWTAEEINASTFGAFYAAQVNTGEGISTTVRVDHIRITIYYTSSSSGSGMTFSRSATLNRFGTGRVFG